MTGHTDDSDVARATETPPDLAAALEERRSAFARPLERFADTLRHRPSPSRHAAGTRVQAMLDRFLQARNNLARAAQRLDHTMESIRGGDEGARAAAPAAPLTETRFFPALELLAEEYERLARDIGGLVDELSGLF